MTKRQKITGMMNRGLSQFAAFVILLCVCFSSLHLAVNAELKSSGKAYCPLQKRWVKRAPAGYDAPKERKPLKNICASDEQKNRFTSELLSYLKLLRMTPNEQQSEKLFFAYFEQGKTAIAAFVSSHSTPRPQFISSIRTEKGVNNSRFEIAAKDAPVFVPSPQPLPPTSPGGNNFASHIFREIKNIPRQANPRAPPVLF
jgi:hypothetical protein